MFTSPIIIVRYSCIRWYHIGCASSRRYTIGGDKREGKAKVFLIYQIVIVIFVNIHGYTIRFNSINIQKILHPKNPKLRFLLSDYNGSIYIIYPSSITEQPRRPMVICFLHIEIPLRQREGKCRAKSENGCRCGLESRNG